MRLSTDKLDSRGNVTDGFDYELQAWISGGRLMRCGHRDSCQCNGRKFEGMSPADARRIMTRTEPQL